MCSSPYTSSQASSSSSPRKRKRESDSETDYFDNDHIVKKQRDELITPLTPTSPPRTLSTFQRLTPPSDHEDSYIHNHPQSPKQNNINYFPAPSYVTYLPQETEKSRSSGVFTTIPVQNRLLRDLHLAARAHQSAKKQEDADIWEEEEEIVADHYSEMNKLLASRRSNW